MKQHLATIITVATVVMALSTSSSIAFTYAPGGDHNNDYGGEYADYQDYANDEYGQEQDGLYYDYAESHQPKKGAVVSAGTGGVLKIAATSIAVGIMGAKFHAGRAIKELKRKHKSEQKKLYSQYYNDVYKLGEQNELLQRNIEDLTELVKSTESQAELEAIQRDYDEFKQPDLDSDDRISRAEFSMYVKDYLSNYPGLTEKDYPKFEDFDHDGNGYVSFEEYSTQMAIQAEKAELEELLNDGSDANSGAKAQAYSDLARGVGGTRF
mmetsp:Transcript_12203/g.13814  ORF Transcript_12203/g.13814 Transcript_12203/m.13814 type:complete len:267 (+) Transcript_12203:162-962(+)|eukprot:CAMPEP_0170790286 /NCGR_PEP_ID=MMETSP0733-20121128/20307_1 /TAXON_ID=186038 /ORGANISM="Fragilariopsis kerguelensis, Strain L26-C5" /LENGTH=266 /DNA_ID=CAMNT_0011137693 /DNA_START=124 /DNA_END=924 /DNA_ORIENTATION=-